MKKYIYIYKHRTTTNEDNHHDFEEGYYESQHYLVIGQGYRGRVREAPLWW